MTRFRIVPGESAVVINASSSVHPIHSRTEGIEGFVELDDDGTLRGEVRLDVTRLRSGNPLEDRELRRRIDARRHPTIDGVITHARPADDPGRHHVTGDITFRGVTRSHEDELVVTVLDGDTLRIDGTTTFDVREFGMEPPRILMLRVHPEVNVALEAVARRETEAPL